MDKDRRNTVKIVSTIISLGIIAALIIGVVSVIKNVNAKVRFALTGTPIENNLSELYSLFRFLNPSMFGTMEEFNNYYAIPIQ